MGGFEISARAISKRAVMASASGPSLRPRAEWYVAPSHSTPKANRPGRAGSRTPMSTRKPLQPTCNSMSNPFFRRRAATVSARGDSAFPEPTIEVSRAPCPRSSSAPRPALRFFEPHVPSPGPCRGRKRRRVRAPGRRHLALVSTEGVTHSRAGRGTPAPARRRGSAPAAARPGSAPGSVPSGAESPSRSSCGSDIELTR